MRRAARALDEHHVAGPAGRRQLRRQPRRGSAATAMRSAGSPAASRAGAHALGVRPEDVERVEPRRGRGGARAPRAPLGRARPSSRMSPSTAIRARARLARQRAERRRHRRRVGVVGVVQHRHAVGELRHLHAHAGRLEATRAPRRMASTATPSRHAPRPRPRARFARCGGRESARRTRQPRRARRRRRNGVPSRPRSSSAVGAHRRAPVAEAHDAARRSVAPPPRT